MSQIEVQVPLHIVNKVPEHEQHEIFSAESVERASHYRAESLTSRTPLEGSRTTTIALMVKRQPGSAVHSRMTSSS